MNLRRVMNVSLCAVFMLAVAGCGRSESSGGNRGTVEEKSSKRPVIGFSIDTLAIERWQRDLDVFMAEAKELGADVIVQNAGNSIEEQNRQLLYLAGRGVDVVVVVAKDARQVGDAVERILAKNIPVISYDRLILDAPLTLYITIDSTQVGYIMGQGMKGRTDKKKWNCILGPREDNNMSMILNGLRSAISDGGIVLDEIYYTDGWNYDLSHQLMVDLITQDRIPDVIICGNDAIADSTILALQQYRPGYNVHICGQDADIAACQNIVRGLQDFTVYKPITALAKKAAEYAVYLAEGKNVDDGPDKITSIDNGYGDIPALMLYPRLVDKSNIDEVVIGSGFHTRGEVYLAQ